MRSTRLCRHRLSAIAAAVSLALLVRTAQAGGALGGQIGAQMVLESACSFTGLAQVDLAGLANGALVDADGRPIAFISRPTADATEAEAADGDTVRVSCSPNVTAMALTVGGGSGSLLLATGAAADRGGAGSRVMVQGGTRFLPYEVYSDPARTIAYPAAATPVGFHLPGNGAPVKLPLFGRVQAQQLRTLVPGRYADQLQVTVSW